MTLIIILFTCLLSLAAFKDQNPMPYSMQRPEWFDKMKFNAYMVWHKKQWFRLITSGFIHGSWLHLIFNMLTLYFFGNMIEKYFCLIWDNTLGRVLYICFYISAIAISSISDLIRYKENYAYNAIGASGAVSAVLFACILMDPKVGIAFLFVPIPIPGYIFGPLYLLYCYYMAKKNVDNIGHSAHFWGAVYGIIFPLMLKPQLINLFFNAF